MFDIEMQAAEPSDGTLDLRTRYYLFTIDVDTVRKGQDYDCLRHAFIIFVCAYDPFGLALRRYTFRSRCDEKASLVLEDRAVKIFLNAKGTVGDEDEDIRNFLDYVAGLAARGDFAREVAKQAEQVKRHDAFRREYMTVAMLMRQERKAGFDEGWKDGEAKGLKAWRRKRQSPHCA